LRGLILERCCLLAGSNYQKCDSVLIHKWTQSRLVISRSELSLISFEEITFADLYSPDQDHIASANI
jgi:hypothetical protein